MDIGDLDGDSIQRAGFKDKDFEQLFRRLLAAERELRHRKDAEIRGPVATYRGDQQRDLMFTVLGPPRTPRHDFTAALTWDEKETTWYSCKGGGGWKRDILNELGRSARNAFENEGKKPTKKVKNRPSSKLLDHLEGGGRYVFVIAHPAIDNASLLDEVKGLLTFWFEQQGRTSPAELRAQLEFIDGNRLADFIRTHRPNLTEVQRRALQLTEPAGLKGWDHWTEELGVDRDLPDFQADAQREALLEAVADPQRRILRIFGPPGVGKTRVVHEGIRRCGPDARARVRYSDDVTAGLDSIDGSWLRDGAKPWLVLDEARTTDVDAAIAKFRANATQGARLILVGTSDSLARAVPPEHLRIEELGEPQTRRLIESEAVGLSAEQREAIWRLSEGYPWYAVLLTRAVSVNEEVLESGDDEATRWSSGALRVLAGNRTEFSDEARWQREAELRAKTLLVAILTRDLELEWDELWERHGERLRKAIGESVDLHEVVRLEKECRGRQLLRQSGLRSTRRYVSPNNLARLVINHFLTDPDDLGPRIRKHAPQFRSALVDAAKAVGVRPSIIERLARGEWDEIDRRSSSEGVKSVDDYMRVAKPVYEAAHDVAERAALTMSTVVARAHPADLANAGNLRAVATVVFEHVIHRKISSEAFLATEAALIQLARVDDSPFSNNAVGVWTSIFKPCLHLTHQPWESRKDRLDDRLRDSDSFVRELAIEALGPAVEPREQGLGYSEIDKADGDWPVPTVTEVRERKVELWCRLLRACDDHEPTLARRARSIVSERVRGSLGRGLFPDDLRTLRGQVAGWSAAERHQLAESLADVRRYDMEDYAEFPDLVDALAELERASAPAALEEQVRAQIGSWQPGPWKLDDPDRRKHEAEADLGLARALLEDPAALSWTMEWLASGEAHRANAMWVALGRADRGGELLQQLVDPAKGAIRADALGRYLLGWAEEHSAEQVEHWLSSLPLSEDDALRRAATWFLVFQRPSEARLARLREFIDLGTIVPEALMMLPFRGWDDLSVASLVEFFRATVGSSELGGLSLRLGVTFLERNLESAAREVVLEGVRSSLRTLVEKRVPIGLQAIATKASRMLVESGDSRFVVKIVLDALSMDPSGSSHNARLGYGILMVLLRDGYADEIWPMLAEALLHERGELFARRFRRFSESGLLGFIDDSTVLDWVGHESSRALAVAALTIPHTEPLDPITRELLVRFGPNGPVGRRLQRNALSSAPRVIRDGMNRFYETQRDNARAWQVGAQPAVATWAREVEGILEDSLREHEARIEHHAKYG